jgi:pimeloyl-ACP methyl ester carboxylesterase
VRRQFRLAAAGACVALLAACTSTVSGRGSAVFSTPSPTGTQAQLAQFHDCSAILNLGAVQFPNGRGNDLTVTCAELRVPLDYADETGTTIRLELVKVHDRHNSSGNSLVVNPGGPGGSGIEAAIGLATQVSDNLLSHFDLVGFDPRGVGLSAPIVCLSDTAKDRLNAASFDVRTPAGFAGAKASAKQFAGACAQKYGAALADYDTVQTAKDMDVIRAALGASQLNYLGFSYGTELGGVYAHLFPHNLRVAVLDGAVDPLTDDITSFANQLGGFEGAFDQFAADCRSRSSCSSIGDPRQAVYDIVTSATANPIPSGTSSDTRTATTSLVLTGVAEALYSSHDWPTLGTALSAARDGKSEGLLRLADQYNQRSSDGTYSNILDANTAVSCNDSPAGPSDATIRATADRWVRAYPMFGLWAAQSLFTCQQWQPARTPVPRPSAATPQQVLVIGNLHDPATPYQGAKDLTSAMGNAELLTWNGEGHTSYLSGSSCIDNFVDNYLISGTLPPDHTTCPR